MQMHVQIEIEGGMAFLTRDVMHQTLLFAVLVLCIASLCLCFCFFLILKLPSLEPNHWCISPDIVSSDRLQRDSRVTSRVSFIVKNSQV